MKKYINKYSLIVITITFCFSCNVLDQEPKVQIDEELAIVDENSSRAALVGLYDALQHSDYYGASFLVSVDMFTEDVLNSAFKVTYMQLIVSTCLQTILGQRLFGFKCIVQLMQRIIL
jgi:hypothetical protein